MLGALVALALSRYRIHGGAAINLLLVLPITTPEIVMGASLFTLFFNQDAAVRLLDDRHRPHRLLPELRGDDDEGPHPRLRLDLEDAAMDLGSPPLRTFLKITLPLITPGHRRRVHALVGPVDRRLHHHLVRRRTVRTFPRQVFDASRVTIPPQAQVLATMIMLVAVVIIVGGTIIANRRAARS